jgi:prophage maintenance system killer protein
MIKELKITVLLPQLERIGFRVRDERALERALSSQSQPVEHKDADDSLWIQAAGVFESVIKHRPMIERNEAAAWLAMNVLLAINGQRLRADSDSGLQFVQGSSGMELDKIDRANWIDRHSVPMNRD